MSGDYSRDRFDPSNGYIGVRKQQGRVDLDADWNEAVDIQDRRWRAETVDLIGRTYLPRETPDGFKIEPERNKSFTIGLGRIYVDGLQAENRGTGGVRFDPVLTEEYGTSAVSYLTQPFLPNPEPLTESPHLVYLDVWQREVTYIEAPDLLEKALGGVDTTVRLQTVWQVKTIPLDTETTAVCSSRIPDWERLTDAPAGRLSTFADAVSASDDLCVTSLSAGYRGVENQLYRVEIHDEGGFLWPIGDESIGLKVIPLDESNRFRLSDSGQIKSLWPDMFGTLHAVSQKGQVHPLGIVRILEIDTSTGSFSVPKIQFQIPDDSDLRFQPVATFKWSRENASITFAVQAISGGEVTLSSLGQDNTRAIRVGDWVEILDDHREFHGEPGDMAKVTEINEADQKFTLDRTLPLVGRRPFAVNAEEHNERHTRMRRWDQSQDVNSNGVIPVTAEPIELEKGIKITFSKIANSKGKVFRSGNYWMFVARTVDGSIEELKEAPPKGVHHHFCRLAMFDVSSKSEIQVLDDCRPWNSSKTAGCCVVTVGDNVHSHGDFNNDIQSAVDAVPMDGKVCILPGSYNIESSVKVKTEGVTIQGCGSSSKISGSQLDETFPLFIVSGSRVSIQNLYLETENSSSIPVLKAQGAAGISLIGCEFKNKADEQYYPAVLLYQCSDARIKNCYITGFPSLLFISGLGLDVADNQFLGGGIWISSGSAEISINNNRILNGNGPGILLGNIDEASFLRPLIPKDEHQDSFYDFMFIAKDSVRSEAKLYRKILFSDKLLNYRLEDARLAVRPDTIKDVQIKENTIKEMEGSGITTAYKVKLDSLFDVVDLGSILGIEVTDNRIVSCIQAQPDCEFPDGTHIAAGIILTGASNVQIRDNYIETGRSHPASGILMGNCSNIDTLRNMIYISDPFMYVREHEYLQVGVGLLSCKPTIVPGQRRGYSARIHHNVIHCATGQALVVISTGSLSIVENHLESHEFRVLPALIKDEVFHYLGWGQKLAIESLRKFACVLIVQLVNRSLGSSDFALSDNMTNTNCRAADGEAFSAVGVISNGDVLISNNTFNYEESYDRVTQVKGALPKKSNVSESPSNPAAIKDADFTSIKSEGISKVEISDFPGLPGESMPDRSEICLNVAVTGFSIRTVANLFKGNYTSCFDYVSVAFCHNIATNNIGSHAASIWNITFQGHDLNSECLTLCTECSRWDNNLP